MLTVIAEFIYQDLDREPETRAGALDMGFWDAGLLQKRKDYGVSDRIFNLIPSFFANSAMKNDVERPLF